MPMPLVAAIFAKAASSNSAITRGWIPVLLISPEAADRLLATAGSSLAELDRQGTGLLPGGVFETRPGAAVSLSVVAEEPLDDVYYNVIGFIPGTGAEMTCGIVRGPESTGRLLHARMNESA